MTNKNLNGGKFPERSPGSRKKALRDTKRKEKKIKNIKEKLRKLKTRTTYS